MGALIKFPAAHRADHSGSPGGRLTAMCADPLYGMIGNLERILDCVSETLAVLPDNAKKNVLLEQRNSIRDLLAKARAHLSL